MSTDSGHRNRLADEPSPYLRQHASNPVDWYPWADEALARAKAEDKPILLSVGYSACHWCHVMAHESFENAQTAEVMNANFVNIKLDREERPDLDQLYQGVVQLMGRGGGWPLTVFLTPDLRPFYGGTYFPPAPRHGLPAFSSLLLGIAEAWRKERSELDQQADTFKTGLTDYAAYGLDSGKPGSAFELKDIETAARKTASRLDPVNGGFGSRGPKFPNPMSLALVFRGWRRTKDEALLTSALFTLEKMALGGIYDQLGGGFSRYSVDERWLVPHFEKMLYDNAQLLHLYSEAMQLAPRPLWRKVVEETVAYVEREMTSPDGAFYAAQDADSEGEEGKFFVWRQAELKKLLGAADAELITTHFGVMPDGNFEHGTSIFEAVKPVAEQDLPRFNAARKVLFDARAKRVAPGRDDKVLAGWNGLMLRGLALASRVFRRPEWAELASRAADFMLAKLRRAGGLSRSYQEGQPRLDGMLEDFGDLSAGLVALYQATFDTKYLEAAEQLADQAVTLFWDESKQAYLAAPKGQKDLLVPTYALHDNAFPSGASSLTEAHVALAALTGRAHHLDQAAKYLQTMRAECLDNPMGYGHLLLAADSYLDGAAEVTVVGEAPREFMERLDALYLPTLSVHRHAPSAPMFEVTREVLSARTARGETTAYLCRHFACQTPVNTVAAFDALLAPLR